MDITLEQLAQWVGYASAIGAGLWGFLKFSRRGYTWIKNRLSLMQNIQNSLLRIDSDVSSIKKELQHNGGSSLKDYVSRLDAELIKQEKRQKALIQDLTYGTFETDATGKVVHVNRTYCRLSGRTPDELMGSGWINCIENDRREEVARNWYLSVSENRDWTDSFSLVIPTGGSVHIIFTATPMFNTKNALIGYFGTIQPHSQDI